MHEGRVRQLLVVNFLSELSYGGGMSFSLWLAVEKVVEPSGIEPAHGRSKVSRVVPNDDPHLFTVDP